MRAEARVVAQPYVMHDLRDEHQIANDYHPLVVTKKVGEGKVDKEAEICVQAIVQNWM